MLRRGLALLFVALVSTTTWAAEKPDLIQGYWLGEWNGKDGMAGKNVAEICGLGNGEYQATFTAYDGSELEKGVFTFAIRGSTTAEGKVVFTQRIDLGLLGAFSFDAEIKKDQLRGKYSNGSNYEGTIDLKRMDRKSDRVGAKPLPGAVPLFDGRSLEDWTILGDEQPAWTVTDGIVVAPTSDSVTLPDAGHLASKLNFNDAQLHVEFRVPYLPEKREQERGQSGIYLWGRYELQILDSFGVTRIIDSSGEFADDDALGAIYKQRPPTELPAFPPGEWQAFDITMLAARADADGKVNQPAEVTVLLNGTLIQDRVPLKEPTQDAPLADSNIASGLVIQNGGQPVEFRNLWVVPLDGPISK